MRMRMLAVLAAFLLPACLESETPRIPVAELAQPADLDGLFWMESLAGQQVSPGIGRFARGEGGYMTLEVAGSDDAPNRLRLFAIRPPDVFAMVTDVDDDRSFYQVMERRRAGIWQSATIASLGGGTFGAANFAYAQQVAARHGLTLDGSDPDSTAIEGPVHGTVIPELFRDPAFLAALVLEPTHNYLPAPRWPADLRDDEDLLPAGNQGSILVVGDTKLAGADWVQPPWLSGRFIEQAEGAPPSSVVTEVRPLPDGRFESRTGENVSHFRVIRFDSEGELFLMVKDSDWPVGQALRHWLTLLVLARKEAGWSIDLVRVRGTWTQVGRLDLVGAPMAAAARRHGLKMDGAVLAGPVAAKALVDLLHDGAFTIGLDGRTDGRITMLRLP